MRKGIRRVQLQAVLVTVALWATSNATDSVTEPEKKIPVVYDVDVAVAGGGPTGIFAAIAAARSGAKTVLIERFGSLGGISGPGLNPGGGTQRPGPTTRLDDGYSKIWIYPEIAGITLEFTKRLEGIGGTRKTRLEASSAISYLALKMMQESGVHLLLSTLATDPIMEGNTVGGVFVENKSGRQAVRAKVVIDCTGEADIARRAGAPILYPKESYRKIDSHAPTGMGLWAYVGGVDWDAYNAAIDRHGPKGEPDLQPRDIDGLAKVLVTRSSSRNTAFSRMREGSDLAAVKVQLARPHGKVDAGSGEHIAKLERGMRLYVFEAVQQMKKEFPGCKNIYLLEISPYLGARGGPCIDGVYTMTMDDCKAGRRFDDVMYLFGEARALRYTCLQEGKCKWPDVPYRVMVPKKIDGLLCAGRSASGIPDTLLRNRTAVKHMGEAAGTAAALAVKDGVSPRQLDVKKLQRKLLEAGFYLGDETRLKELGLR